MKSPPFSYHIFSFPFTINGEDFAKTGLGGFSANKMWELQRFSVKDPVTYNQATYFHPFAHEALFGKENHTTHVYSYGNLCEATYDIHIDKYGSKYQYRLSLEEVLLRVYDSGIGILTFFTKNYRKNFSDIPTDQDFTDILRINDYGRRLYPQYLSTNNKGTLTTNVKNSFLATKLSVTFNKKKEIIKTTTFRDFESLTSKVFDGKQIFPEFVNYLLPDLDIQPIIDDRMFTLCLFPDDESFNGMVGQVNDKTLKVDARIYLQSNQWHEFIFLDNDGSTFQNPIELPGLLKKHTYDRWAFNKYEDANSGNIVGITRYSFMILANNNGFTQEHLANHLCNLYEPMTAFCLAQRASVLSYSRQVAEVSGRLDNNSISNEISKLYKSYIWFVNSLSFREITPQEQGIELYSMLKSVMGIDNEIKDLDQELSELNQYVEIKAQREIGKIANKFLPAALIAAMLAFISDKNYFQFNTLCLDTWDCLVLPLNYIILILVVLITYRFGGKLMSSSRKQNK